MSVGSTAAPVLDLDFNNSNGRRGGLYRDVHQRRAGDTGRRHRRFHHRRRQRYDRIGDDHVGESTANRRRAHGQRTCCPNDHPDAYDPVTGVLTLTGAATLADYQTALRQVVFNTTSTSTADRIIQVTVNDGIFDSNIGTTYMHVVANVAPALNLDADSSTIGGVDYLTTFTDGGSAVAIVDTDVLITDSDDIELTSATVTLTNPDTDDVLLFNGTPPAGITASLYDPVTGILTLTGTASLAAYQAALQQIRFATPVPRLRPKPASSTWSSTMERSQATWRMRSSRSPRSTTAPPPSISTATIRRSPERATARRSPKTGHRSRSRTPIR